MECTHFACVGSRRHVLPGNDTSCYASGDIVTAGGRHLLLGQAHREHYGTNDAGLSVSWQAEEIEKVDPDLTRARD